MRTLVTGGGGFLGAVLVRQLLARGDAVTLVARGRYPALEALGARGVQIDLGAPGAGLSEVAAGHDVVFHVAAKAGVWGPDEEFTAINVGGTLNVIRACQEAGVGRLVYTSSPSVVFAGGDHENANQDLPYPASYDAPYPRTKAEAERAVLAANSPGLVTTALRPHLIYGPGEPHMIPRLRDRHQKGRLRIIGNGKNKVSLCYVDNAAVAHLQAADRLTASAPHAGKAWFVNDSEPVLLWEWVNALFRELGEPPLTRSVSPGVALLGAHVASGIWSLFSLAGEPPITPFAVKSLSTSHWYDIQPANQAFGYVPLVDGAEGFARTVAAFRAESASV